MSSNRIYKFKLLILIFCFAVTGRLVAADDLSLNLNKFLAEIPAVNKDAHENLFKNIIIDNDIKYSGCIDAAGVLYSLVIMDYGGGDADAEDAARSIAAFKASSRLAFYIGRAKADKNIFKLNNALENALFNYYLDFINNNKVRGMERAADIIDNKIFALAWLNSETVKALETLNLNDKLFIENCLNNCFDYCKELVSAERCIEALNELNELESLKFDLSSDNLMRMGRLYREAGDKSKALNAFRLARKRYHEENKQGAR